MKLNREIPCVYANGLRLTISEAEQALGRAAAFIRLARSLHPDMAEAAEEWIIAYGENEEGAS